MRKLRHWEISILTQSLTVNVEHTLFFFFIVIFYLFMYLFIYLYLFLTVLGLRFCARAFSSCGKWGPLFIAVRGPLTIAASLVAEHRLQTRRLSSCGSRAQLLCSMWDLPRPGLEPVSPALAGRFSTTAPPGKPEHTLLITTLPDCLSMQRPLVTTWQITTHACMHPSIHESIHPSSHPIKYSVSMY